MRKKNDLKRLLKINKARRKRNVSPIFSGDEKLNVVPKCGAIKIDGVLDCSCFVALSFLLNLSEI